MIRYKTFKAECDRTSRSILKSKMAAAYHLCALETLPSLAKKRLPGLEGNRIYADSGRITTTPIASGDRYLTAASRISCAVIAWMQAA